MLLPVRNDANRFYTALQNRLGKFNFGIAVRKTKIISFGRFAEEKCTKQGEKKPDTFDFLGFTHFRTEATRAGFTKLWTEKNYKPILDTVGRLPESFISRDDKLLMYVDLSSGRV